MSTISSSSSSPDAVSILTAFSKTTVKAYFIDSEGKLKSVPYGNEKHFRCQVEPVTDIYQLATLLTQISSSQNKIIIRGQPKPHATGMVRRTLDNYSEPAEGLSWAMLDFDNIKLPEGQLPTSIDAIEYVIARLPEPFHEASYFYQFSSSTGIVHPDGTPLKRGLNVHLFFWFSQPITGALLKAYLTDHCIKTDFLERGRDKVDSPRITYGVDMALFNAVQPHYIAAPIIKPGVTRTLDEKDRQGLVEKLEHSVVLPYLNANLPYFAQAEHNRISSLWKRDCGWVRAKSITKSVDGGVAIHYYHHNPNPAAIATGRTLAAEPRVTERKDQNGQSIFYATLYFDDEGTPGSWYVSSRSPCMARRFGDYAEESLKELSEDAYCYVRDVLKWFSDVEIEQL